VLYDLLGSGADLPARPAAAPREGRS
jgi:hypothetical protein